MKFPSSMRGSCCNNETGLLYKHCDTNDAAFKVRGILIDEPLRERLIEKGHEWAFTFSWERNTREILEYLQGISAVKHGSK